MPMGGSTAHKAPPWCVGRYGGTTAYLWVGDSPAEVSGRCVGVAACSVCLVRCLSAFAFALAWERRRRSGLLSLPFWFCSQFTIASELLAASKSGGDGPPEFRRGSSQHPAPSVVVVVAGGGQ